ncbi:MAG: preprotein translocase subunit YajC [Planctomycetes bacterium]|nr:preprotein translocase subunit YajC [Planctomycetota bacterium]
MIVLNTSVCLAQATPPTPSPMSYIPIAFLFAMIVLMFMTARSQKNREKKERDNMYTRLAKNDRVLTIGGIIGTIIAVKDTEVVLKVDESTNTKMTFMKTAVQRILSDEPSDSSKT